MDINLSYQARGFTFLRNKKSKEIHRLKNVKGACGIGNMNPENAGYCTWLWAHFLVGLRGYNGCAHCWKEKDTDKK